MICLDCWRGWGEETGAGPQLARWGPQLDYQEIEIQQSPQYNNQEGIQ